MAGKEQRAGLQPGIPQIGIAPATPDTSVASRTPRRLGRLRILGAAGVIGGTAALGGVSVVSAADQYTPRIETQDYSTQLTRKNLIFVEAAALAPRIGKAVPVPDSYPAIKVRALTRGVKIDGVRVPRFSEGRWSHLIYDPEHAGQNDNYEGIGPHFPVVKTDLNPNASTLRSDGTTGRLIITAREGGRVQIGFMQLDAFQDDGAWSDGVQNPAWEMQYVFNGLRSGQPIMPVDADTGKRLRFKDGSLAQYIADSEGKIAFEIPETHGNDVRVGFVFDVQAAQQIIIDRGPNDHPETGLANSLPRKGIIKPMLPGQRR